MIPILQNEQLRLVRLSHLPETTQLIHEMFVLQSLDILIIYFCGFLCLIVHCFLTLPNYSFWMNVSTSFWIT